MTDKETLDKIIVARKTYRDKLQLLLTEVNSQYANRSSHALDLAHLTLLSGKITNYSESVFKFDADIGGLITDATDFAKETTEAVDLQDAVWDAQGRLSILLGSVGQETRSQGGDSVGPAGDETRSVAGTSQSQGQFAHQVRLPKLELPKYSGDPLHWQEFWDSYDSTVHQQNFSNIDKFKYLKTTLSGDAARLVDGFRLTDANYETVIDALKERYGNPEIAVFAHFEQLLALPPASGDTATLTSTYDQCERHIRSLVALGLTEETFGMVFTPIILSKLPRNLRVELHRRNGPETWQLCRLRELFRDELKARQMGDWSLADRSKKDPKGGNDPKHKPNHHHYHNNNKSNALPSTSTFMHGSTKTQYPGKGATSSGGGGTTARQGAMACIFCKGAHYSDQCTRVPGSTERRAIVTRNGHCFKCLSTNHIAKSCKKTVVCFYCSGHGHHSSLCTRRGSRTGGPHLTTTNFTTQQHATTQPQQSASQGAPPGSQGSGYQMNPGAPPFTPNNHNTHAAAADGSLVHMQMAYVKFLSNGIEVWARMFFDQGSSCTYILRTLSKRLGLKPYGSTLVSNARFADPHRTIRSYESVSVAVPTLDGSAVLIDAFVTDLIAPDFQKLPLSTDQFPILGQLPLADWLSDQPESVSVDILIGQDHYFDFVTSEQIRLDGGLILLGSKLGYISTGKIHGGSKPAGLYHASSFLAFSDRGSRVHNADVERLYALDSIGITDDSSQNDDDLAVQQFEQSIRKVENGRYEAGWPYKEKSPDLPDNFGHAAARLGSQLRKLHQTPGSFDAYDEILQSQVQSGIIEVVENPNAPTTNLVHYLPHHAVVKPTSATTKIRIVHDASAKASKSALSLNDCLLRGPVFLSDLCGLLLRFRFNPVAFVCDIEKAFFQVGLRPNDRDVTRFLWVRDPQKAPKGENLVTYRFTKVPFGVISSPFLLTATIKHHLAQSQCEFAPEIARNLYVDNLLCGQPSVETAKVFFDTVVNLFSEICMNIREWFTNSPEFRQLIPPDSLGTGHITKVLGMVWNTNTDGLSYPEFDPSSHVVSTKRHLVQAVSTIFDPCGLLTPVLVQPKLLIQETWRRDIKWDDPLPDDILAVWNSLAPDLSTISNFQIPRFIGLGDGIHLHCFADASGKAYAASVYAVSPKLQASQLLISKSKLAPLKPVTLPRLELVAIVIGTRLIKFAMAQLSVPITGCTLWSDSKCALQWIHSSKVLSVFVNNRVKEIRDLKCDFRYVPTKENPADLPTRGLTVAELQGSKLWWLGPEFLVKPKDSWPPNDLKFAPARVRFDMPLEKKTTSMVQQARVVPLGLPSLIDPTRFSTLQKLIRVSHLVMRFCSALKNRIAGRKSTVSIKVPSGLPTAAEITALKLDWVSWIQRDSLERDPNFPNLKRQLELFRDQHGLWRCGGRMRHSQLTDDAKFPLILPKGNHLTHLVIHDCHRRVLHAGVHHTMVELRNEFWVPSCKSQVQSVLHKCGLCRLWEGGPYCTPQQPPLPEFRVTQLEPFECTGLDYMGPLLVRQGAESKKIWILLFTCTVTRAIHLEVVHDLTTDQFLLAFRRFVAIHSKPRLIISDNGKQFKQANDILGKLWAEIMEANAVQHHLAEQSIEWKFIPEHAPWMGGFYERLVGSVKRSLKKVLGRNQVSVSQMITIVAEIAAVLNTRPLLSSSDVNDPILTPADLLGKKRHRGLPMALEDPSNSADPSYFQGVSSRDKLLEGWKQNENVLKQFWDVWLNGYLTSLRESHRAARNTRGAQAETPSEGAVVLIHEKHLARSLWKVGVIIRLNESFDGITRSAVVQVSNGKTLVRPVKLLFPIEIGHQPETQISAPPTTDANSSGVDGNLRHSAQIHTQTSEDDTDGRHHQPESLVNTNSTSLRDNHSPDLPATAGNIRQSVAPNAPNKRSKRKAAASAHADIQAQLFHFSDDE